MVVSDGRLQKGTGYGSRECVGIEEGRLMAGWCRGGRLNFFAQSFLRSLRKSLCKTGIKMTVGHFRCMQILQILSFFEREKDGMRMPVAETKTPSPRMCFPAERKRA